MRVKIDVTADDIKLGSKGEYATCAVARACRRALKKQFICEGTDSCYVYVEDRKTAKTSSFELKSNVTKWINKFDENKKLVKPFSFYLTS